MARQVQKAKASATLRRKAAARVESNNNCPHRERVANPINLDEFLPFQIAVVANRLAYGGVRQLLDTADIGISEWRVVSILAHYGATTASDVAELSGVDKANISRAIASLRRKGAVIAESDPNDQRRKMVSLTERGVKIFDRVAPGRLSLGSNLASCLSANERKALLRTLHKLDDHMRAVLRENHVKERGEQKTRAR